MNIQLLLLISSLFANLSETQEPRIDISFDSSAVDYVSQNPEIALDHTNETWRRFEGYQLVLDWHEMQAVPDPHRVYNRRLSRLIKAQDESYVAFASDIKEFYTENKDEVIQHITRYLPEDVAFNARAFFVMFTVPYAFSLSDTLVMDVGSRRWKQNTNYLMNILIHETYHIGYDIKSPDRIGFQPKTREEFVHKVLSVIQNEGMATFVAYEALELFPSEIRHEDYDGLEAATKIIEAVGQINELLARTTDDNVQEMEQEAWRTGIAPGRAFYIAGAYMAKVIKENKGLDFLVDLIEKDSKIFVQEYNSLVDEDFNVMLE